MSPTHLPDGLCLYSEAVLSEATPPTTASTPVTRHSRGFALATTARLSGGCSAAPSVLPYSMTATWPSGTLHFSRCLWPAESSAWPSWEALQRQRERRREATRHPQILQGTPELWTPHASGCLGNGDHPLQEASDEIRGSSSVLCVLERAREDVKGQTSQRAFGDHADRGLVAERTPSALRLLTGNPLWGQWFSEASGGSTLKLLLHSREQRSLLGSHVFPPRGGLLSFAHGRLGLSESRRGCSPLRRELVGPTRPYRAPTVTHSSTSFSMNSRRSLVLTTSPRSLYTVSIISSDRTRRRLPLLRS